MRTTVARAARAVMATAVGITLVLTAAPAFAQEPVQPPVADQPEPPTDVEQPRPLLSAIAHCPKGVPTVEVHVRDDREDPYGLTLLGSGSPFSKHLETTFDEERFDHSAVFADVPPGQYRVVPDEGDQTSGGVDVVVTDCKATTPAESALEVDVVCKAGWGIVTFTVTNSTGETKKYTLSASTGDVEFNIEVSEGTFLRVTDNGYEDGEFFAQLSGKDLKEPIRKEFTVACAAENAPKVRASAHCDGKDDLTGQAPIFVEIENPNRSSVDYTVKGAGTERTLPVGGGATGMVELDPLPAGDYTVTVAGSDSTITKTGVGVDNCATVVIDEDGLQVETRCADGKSVVTFRYFPVSQGKRSFKVDGDSRYDNEIEFGAEEHYLWERWTAFFDDGTYTARLVGGGLNTVEKFTVNCSGTPTSTTTAPPAPTTTSVPPVTPVASESDLPVTGAAVGGMIAWGAGALAFGALLLLVVRRRRAAR
ncbi:hypothetical protein [Actinokineospora sp. HUAS TT18]|uniref:hypothetical protein n=1 Tax=Actinokineospora sp. HUAS TT18 TaxID=3447451 RepID=UPI003F51B27C